MGSGSQGKPGDSLICVTCFFLTHHLSRLHHSQKATTQIRLSLGFRHPSVFVTDPTGNSKAWFFINNSSNGWDNGLSNQMQTCQGACSFTTTPPACTTPLQTGCLLRTVNTTWTQNVF